MKTNKMKLIDKNTLISYIDRAHQTAKEKGFHEDQPSAQKKQRMLALIISELGEAMEAMRKNKRAEPLKYISLINSEGYETTEKKAGAFEQLVKDTLEDEIADTMIRIFDFCGLFFHKYTSIWNEYEQTVM